MHVHALRNDYFFNYFVGGQEKIVRAFAEVMKNMARMKACVRPAMCKPYGKQSEALQKSNKIRNIYHDLSFNIIFRFTNKFPL